MVKSTYQILKEIRDLIRAVILMLLAIMIFLILGCTKPPITLPINCSCGHIIRNTNDGELWTVVIKNDCSGELDTTVWHFNMDDFRVGDVVCRLHEVELDSCKR